ncbi:MAG: EF-hand domain-containing protein [Verrucomicrobia bacterium]|nr:EF-hand domain-containing protein [Verrucomicrobiota bacterium]|tara:strand:+ start:59122 stop:59694 length:573 start_codon:yes stop_codon:yes gene_type:complete
MKTILVCALCFGTVASSAFAESERRSDESRPDGGKRPDREFRERDGKYRKSPFGRGGEMFKRMDSDGDGMISKEEFFASPRLSRLPEEKLEGIFGRLDGDGDGALSKKEIHQIRKEGAERARGFRELDVDSSGGLNFDEFSEGKFFKKLPEEKRREIFGRLDTNGDGEISPKDKPDRPRRPDRPGKKKKD